MNSKMTASENKSYKVSFRVADAAIISGEKPHDNVRQDLDDYVEGENREEVIDNTFSYLFESLDPDMFEGEVVVTEDFENEEITVMVDDVPTLRFYDFLLEENE